MLITSGTGVTSHLKPGQVSTEEDRHPGSKTMARAASEEAADELVAQGGRVGVVRLPQVHNTQNKAESLESTSPVGYRTRVSLSRQEAGTLLSLPRPHPHGHCV
jgi:hypothetical protein